MNGVAPRVIIAQSRVRRATFGRAEQAMCNAGVRNNGPGPAFALEKPALPALPRPGRQDHFPAHGAPQSAISLAQHDDADSCDRGALFPLRLAFFEKGRDPLDAVVGKQVADEIARRAPVGAVERLVQLAVE